MPAMMCHSFLNASESTFVKIAVVSLRSLVPAVLLFCLGCPADSSPPDLSGCTRIEVQYHPSALKYLLLDVHLHDVLSREEKDYVESLSTLDTENAEFIEQFVRAVRASSYKGPSCGMWLGDIYVHIACYRGKERLTSFDVYGQTVVTEDHRVFESSFLVPVQGADPRLLRSLRLRFECALNMGRLSNEYPLYEKEPQAFPDPNGWCDILLRGYRRMRTTAPNRPEWRTYNEERIYNIFTCPNVRQPPHKADSRGIVNEVDAAVQPELLIISDYAVNSGCRFESAPDTVLLFETKTGWNQHGGPELFTFGNHDPRGGLVLLRNGTVKFIRTEEELKQLRWK
jgi:hypothetical protein